MPRLSTSLILRAYRQDPLLPCLLKECRTFDSARNELRWLQEKAIQSPGNADHKTMVSSTWRRRLRVMCSQRARGKPLQYIIGNQPFGDLEIICRKGVLIPRVETEMYTFHTADLILNALDTAASEKISKKPPLRILDLCSGTGCISLLLHAVLASTFQNLMILGVDISSRATKLARNNLVHNIRLGNLSDRAKTEVLFRQADVLDSPFSGIPPLRDVISNRTSRDINEPIFGANWDILISNPPYISPSCLADGTTARSVRVHEPLRALVPSVAGTLGLSYIDTGHVNQEDLFYPRLLSLAFGLGVNLAVFECGDLAQARRVVEMVHQMTRQPQNDVRWKASIWNEGQAGEADLTGARAVVLERN